MKNPKLTPSNRLLAQVVRFGVSTGFSATLSVGMPIFLHEVFEIDPKVAVAIAFATAYVANIFLLKLFVFRSTGSWLAQLAKYIPINGAFRLAEYAFFLLLYSALAIEYRVAIIISLGVSAVFKFFIYRIIFRD